MSTRAQQAQILRNPAVLDQLAGALLAAASNILNEAAEAANHPNRAIFANVIFSNPLNAAALMAPGLMANPTLQAQAGATAGASGTPFSDGDVDYVVASLYDIYANRAAASMQQLSAPAPVVAQ